AWSRPRDAAPSGRPCGRAPFARRGRPCPSRLPQDGLGDEALTACGEIALQAIEADRLAGDRQRLDGAPEVLLDGGEIAAERGEDGLEGLLDGLAMQARRILLGHGASLIANPRLGK